MGLERVLWRAIVFLIAVAVAAAQDFEAPGGALPPPAGAAGVPADSSAGVPDECYSAGSVAGAVVGTLIVTLLLLAAVVAVYKFYWRGRRGKHLILTKDPEADAAQYAFDNPCFRDASPSTRPSPEKDANKTEQKPKWSGWPNLGALAGSKGSEKRRALDDSCLVVPGEATPQQRLVTLRSRDFTGLGFNVCGNMRDGIFVRDVLHRGPAFESGRIQPGDRIEAVRISFRHMVFEDALTILSYASPYEVQLELETGTPSAPSAGAATAGSLLRPRRATSAVVPNERIVHPFFRSQSSADLAQISKASLRCVQQMGGVGGTKYPAQHPTDDGAAGDYPTLKLSSAPSHPPKETARSEKTAPNTVVKPERAKRASTPKEPENPPSAEASNLSKFQKFGVRVLPDPAPRQSSETKVTPIEAEKHQNEQNLIRERVGTNPFNGPQGQDTVDTGNPENPLPYDERGIDVGPIEPPPALASQQELASETSEKQQVRIASTDEEDGHKENNVKQLLTKGLLNLKEKLHHDKRKSTNSPESPPRSKDKKQKPARQHKTSMSSDSEGLDGERSLEGTVRSKVVLREEPEKVERKRQRHPDKDGISDSVPLPPDSGIPSEIPEEVHRAAVAARSNRKSLQTTSPKNAVNNTKECVPITPITRESISESSSDETATDTAAEGVGRPPKRSNKRKAPLPPAEEAEHNLTSTSPSNAIEPEPAPRHSLSGGDSNTVDTNVWNNAGNPENLQKHSSESGKIITTFANLAKLRNNPELPGKDVTNITIDNGNPSTLCALTSKRVGDGELGAGQTNTFPVDSSSSGTSTMETKAVDYDDSIHVSTVNSDSDSDLERLEGGEDVYDGKRTKKGGTTIELNSSHITIHHSPSSDTMQMSADLESDSTRKAASLGDLSRLDSEQPMSILERAVSLDLGDGATPHSSKKRKAPLPPPGDEYLSSAPDTDDGAHYRKEPRLDSAMDTFQRRRLKKSSDWGTLEEALKQTDGSSNAQKSIIIDTAHMELETSKHPERENVMKQNVGAEIANLADDQKVRLSGLSQKFSDAVRVEGINISGIESIEDQKVPIKSSQNVDNIEHLERSSPECDHSVADLVEMEVSPSVLKDNTLQQQKKTVLHISPEVSKRSVEINSANVEDSTNSTVSPSQVTIASSSIVGLRGPVREPADQDLSLNETTDMRNIPMSSSHRIGNIVSSTPLPNRERIHPSDLSSPVHSSSSEHSFVRETVQSPLVTSSDAGVSNIHVSSTTQDISTGPLDIDSNLLVSSATDHFVTAASIVDSTQSVSEDLSDNEDTWGNDLQPPELPTSPVPVLSQASSTSFGVSPSMTYITEIQVVTTTDNENDQTIGSSNLEITHNGTSPISSSYTPGIKKNQSDSSLSSDSIGSGGGGMEDDETECSTYHSADGALSHIPRSSVTVTAIRTTSDASAGPSGGTVTETTTNHVSEKKLKSVRPPVPPRKSELSSPSSSPPSMSSSTIMVEVPKIRLTETSSSSLLAGGSVSQVNPAAAGKFISFSSLSPRAEGSSTRHGSSFEQWVFLDDASPSGHHNGLENTGVSDTDNGQHASVMTLPSLTTNRSQTVTHIILDTKQNSGGQVQE